MPKISFCSYMSDVVEYYLAPKKLTCLLLTFTNVHNFMSSSPQMLKKIKKLNFFWKDLKIDTECLDNSVSKLCFWENFAFYQFSLLAELSDGDASQNCRFELSP